jgi:hypothetical protein
MGMFRRILFIVFIVLTIGATIFAYFYLRSVKKPKVDVSTRIPADCSYVIECDNFFSFSKKLRETSLIWEELQQEPYFQQLNAIIQSIDSVSASNETTREVFENTRIYMARYEQADKSGTFLFAFNLTKLEQEEELPSFLKNNAVSFETIQLSNSSEQVTKLIFKNYKEPVFVYHASGTVLLSQELSLIEKALDKNNKALSADTHFQRLEEDGGNNMDFRLYFRNSFYQSILSPSLFSSFPLTHHNEWTALDFTSVPNEFRVNGFIDSDSTVLMQALRGQNPVETQFVNIAPRTTYCFTFLGISDYPAFSSKLLEKADPVLKDATKKFSDKTESGLTNEWSACFAGEFVLLKAAFERGDAEFGIASISDKTNAAKFMGQIADSTYVFSTAEGKDSVFVFKDENLFGTLSCNIFSAGFSCARVSDTYILFAKNDSLILDYSRELNSYGTLAKSDRFAATQETNLNKECNFYYYSDLSKNYEQSIDLIHPSFLSPIHSSKERLKKFGFAGVQLSAHKGRILTQSCLHYNPVTKQQSLTLWEAQLDTVSSSTPQVLINHKTGNKELFASDDRGTIYLISNTGKIQWKKNLGEKVMSNVYQVDFFKNGKLQMLFNTQNYIHLIDRNGNYVTGYPIKLSHAATNGIAVYDYESTKDYRILIACDDKHVYNYTINGKLTEGFNFPQTEEVVNMKIDFRRINAKDYLIACDKAGNLYGTGRKGEARLVFKNKLGPNCTVYYLDEGKDISRSRLYFFDLNEMALKQLSLDDKVKTKTIESDIKVKDVELGFVNEDKLIDHIISDESGFEILDDEGNRLISFVSKTDIQPGVKTILVNNQQYFLLLDKNDRMLIVDVAGKLTPDRNYFFSVQPLLSVINSDGKPFLIGVYKDKVNCYEFKE